MKRRPLHIRVLTALALAPMTTNALARCLASTNDAVRNCLADLRDAGVVTRCGNEHVRTGRPRDIYRIAA